MKITQKQKNHILDELLETVDWFSDRELQIKGWVELTGFDLGEMSCMFFDDADGIIAHYKDFALTDDQYHVLKSLYDKIDQAETEYLSPEEFIDLPEWIEIRQLAQEVLFAFHYKKKSLFQMKLDKIKYGIISFFTEWLKKMLKIG